MAFAVVLDFAGATVEQYDQVVQKIRDAGAVRAVRAGADHAVCAGGRIPGRARDSLSRGAQLPDRRLDSGDGSEISEDAVALAPVIAQRRFAQAPADVTNS